MSYYLQVDDLEPDQVASSGGLRALRKFVEAQCRDLAQLCHLLEHGWTEECAELRMDVDAALIRTAAPQGVHDTLVGMKEEIENAKELVSLTDGLSHKEDPDAIEVPETKEFDPDQLRDDEGRWTSSGLSSIGTKKESFFAPGGKDYGNPLVSEEEKAAEEIRKKILGSKPMPTYSGNEWKKAPAVAEVSKEISRLNRQSSKLKKGSEEWEENRSMVAKLRVERKETWKAELAAQTHLAGAAAMTKDEAWKLIASPLAEKGSYTYEIEVSSKGKTDVSSQPAAVKWGIVENGKKNVNTAMDFISSVFRNDALPLFQVFASTKGRSEANDDPENPWTNINVQYGPSVVAHEVGHLIEAYSASHMSAAAEFLERRTMKEEGETGGQGKKMSDLNPGKNYDPWEVALPDKFGEPYVGKLYRYRRGAHNAVPGTHSPGTKDYRYTGTEITSMGLQWMFSDPVRFAREDPDYFRFMVQQMHRKPDPRV